MKKILVGSIILISLISMIFAFIPNAFGQPENVQILSYSWHYSSFDHLIVVGEVQNVGPNIIDYIELGGVVYAQGEAKAASITRVLSDQILPQQKAPFRLIIVDDDSYSGELLSWVEVISNVEFEVLTANQTDYYQYQGLEITGDSSSLDQNGFYEVTGNISNTGNQTTGRYWVVSTYYNATGDVIAAGFSSLQDPLSPSQTRSFLATPRIDFDFDVIPYQITSYALSIQMEGPIIPEFPSFLILPLFMVATLLLVIVYRRLLKRTNK